jgi:hypothetical protein
LGIVGGVLILGCGVCGVGGMMVSQWVDTQSKDVEARLDVTELHKAVKAFCNDPRLGAVGFMPSSFDPSGTDPASVSYISRVFPHTGGKLKCGGSRMEGHQCLVFFLCGPNGQGWSNDPRDPCAVGGERIGPYFDPRPGRLTAIRRPIWTVTGASRSRTFVRRDGTVRRGCPIGTSQTIAHRSACSRTPA